jgi:hypothetical protein
MFFRINSAISFAFSSTISPKTDVAKFSAVFCKSSSIITTAACLIATFATADHIPTPISIGSISGASSHITCDFIQFICKNPVWGLYFHCTIMSLNLFLSSINLTTSDSAYSAFGLICCIGT